MSEPFLLDEYLRQHMKTTIPPWARGIAADAPIAPGLARWVNRDFDPPPVGTRVNILAWRQNMDDKGIPGTVMGYQVMSEYLMVWVRPDWRPQWHIKDNPGRHTGMFAGIELELA